MVCINGDKIRGAIFDADGTLLDSLALWDNAGARYLAARGIRPEKNLNEILSPLTLEEGSAYLKERYALPEPPEEIKQSFLRTVADFYRNEVCLLPGAEAVLRALQRERIPMAVATAGDKTLLEAALARLGLLDLFCAILTCSDLHTSKREPTVYLAAASLLGTLPSETLVFEDDPVALQTAASAGFRAYPAPQTFRDFSLLTQGKWLEG